MTLTRVPQGHHVVPPGQELSQAQKSAVGSDSRVTVVQGGPGSGKTEAAVARIVRLVTRLRQDPAWLLSLVPSEQRAAAFRERLRRALSATRCPELVLQRAAASVVAMPALLAGCEQRPAALGGPGAFGASDEAALRERIADAADELAPSLGLSRYPEQAYELLLQTLRHLASRRAHDAMSEADWLRRGMGFVEDAVHLAQAEGLRRLRALGGGVSGSASARNGDPLAPLLRDLRRPGDVTARAPELRSALDRASRAGVAPGELERIRSLVDVAAIDLAEAARREAEAASVRTRLFAAAAALLREWRAETGAEPPRPGGPDAQDGRLLVGAARHVIVDDAHDLTGDELALLRYTNSATAFFITGDQRSAAWRGGGLTRFRMLLRDAGRAVVLLETPRFGAGMGRFTNALGARLWPVSEPNGYAPGISRLDFDPSAADSVELWLVPRRDAAPPGRAEPIGESRRREARAVAAQAGRLATERAGAGADTAVLVQHERAREPFEAALAETGVAPGRVEVRTLEEAFGMEWSTVFVTGLDEPLGGPAPRRGWLDDETGLAVVWPAQRDGRGVWPFSSLLLGQQAAAARDAMARQLLFRAISRARTRVILSGATRERAAGGDSCVAPVEWLRRQLGVGTLPAAPAVLRMGEASVRVALVDGAPAPAA